MNESVNQSINQQGNLATPTGDSWYGK